MADSALAVRVPCLGFFLEARAVRVGRDLCVLVSGGEQPHVGSVSIGIYRASLADSAQPGATVSTFNLTGHKDDAVGNLFAQRLATACGGTVSVTCGIHVDNASQADIEAILTAAELLLAKLQAAVGLNS